jgi:serine/threonine protein kinase
VNAGDRLGAYVVEAVMSRGALSCVVSAVHAELGVPRVLKVLTTHQPAIVERFRDEARSQAKIVHPHVVQVFDVLSLEDGRVALVMERVDGPTLAEWIGDGRPWHEVEPVFRAICDGVAAAHAAGLVHRDLKPSNVLMAFEAGVWCPKLCDFGVAKRLSVDGATQAGDLLGTPLYMAPEQLESSASVDARADIWALGCLLYELRSGAPPFTADTLLALHRAMLMGQRRPPVGPPLVDAVVDAALSVDLGARPATVAALVALLDAGVLKSSRYRVIDEQHVAAGVIRRDVVEALTGRRAVAKVVLADGNGETLARLRREEAVLRGGGVGIVPFVEAFFEGDGEQRAFWLVRGTVGPPVSGGSIAAIERVLTVVAALHARQPPVVIRDLSPTGWEDGPDGWTLADLSAVTSPSASLSSTFAGQFGFVAPETWAGDATPASDVYGVGALAIWALTGASPAHGVQADGRVTWARAAVAPGVAAWMDALIEPNPEVRPTAVEALRRLRALRVDPPVAQRADVAPRPVRVVDRPPPPPLAFPEPPMPRPRSGLTGVPRGVGWMFMGFASVIAMMAVGATLAVVTGVARRTPVEAPPADPSPLGGVAEGWAATPEVQACVLAYRSDHGPRPVSRVDVDVWAAPERPVRLEARPTGDFTLDACLDATEAVGARPTLPVSREQRARWNLDLN